MESTQFEMADQLKNLREKRKSLEDEAKSVGAEADAVEKRLSDKMTEQEVDRFSRNGSTFYLSSRLFASPRFRDKEGKRFIQTRYNRISILAQFYLSCHLKAGSGNA